MENKAFGTAALSHDLFLCIISTKRIPRMSSILYAKIIIARVRIIVMTMSREYSVSGNVGLYMVAAGKTELKYSLIWFTSRFLRCCIPNG